MGLFAPNMVVRPEIRPRSCELDRPSGLSRTSLDQVSFEALRSMKNTQEDVKKSWSWSVKNNLFPRPSIQAMRDSSETVTPSRQSLSMHASSKRHTVLQSTQHNSSPRLLLRGPVSGATDCDQTTMHSKRSSDVPSLVSDDSRTSIDSSNESAPSPQRAFLKASSSRSFPRVISPVVCDVKEGYRQETLRHVRKPHDRARPLITGCPLTHIDNNEHRTPANQLVKTTHSSFYFETSQTTARRSFNAEIMLSKATGSSSKGSETASTNYSLLARRSTVQRFSPCSHAEKYVNKPLPALPTSAPGIGSPQSCARRMQERKRSQATLASCETSIYKVFPAPSVGVAAPLAVTSPRTRIMQPRLNCTEDSMAQGDNFQSACSFFAKHSSSSSTPNTSFECPSSAASSPSSDAITKSYQDFSTQLRGLFLQEDMAYALSLFPSPPATSTAKSP